MEVIDDLPEAATNGHDSKVTELVLKHIAT